MIDRMYAIKDVKVGFFYPPQCFRNASHALRVHADIFATDSGPFKAHSADFDVYLVGEFDNDTGVITPCTPSFLIHGSDLNT